MTPEKILEAANALRQQLEAHMPPGSTPCRCHTAERTKRTPRDIASHSLWMLDQVPGFIAHNRTDKAMRWVCFIQGALWTAGLASIDRLKDMNS